MNYFLLGISVVVIALLIAVYLYFLLRPSVTITNGEYGSSNPMYNPNAFPVGWKSPLNYTCLSTTDCAEGLTCDPYTFICKVSDGDICSSQSVCLSNSFCNVHCYPLAGNQVAYNTPCEGKNCSNLIGMMAPCPDLFQSVLQNDTYVCLKWAGATCSQDTDCASGLCKNTVCQAGYNLGHSCNRNSECSSLNCLNGYCQKIGIVGGGVDDTGYACANERSYYHCQNGTKCKNNFCTNTTQGLGMNCNPYNVVDTLLCYQFSDTTTNGETCVGCKATLCGDGDSNCLASFYINPSNVSDPNSAVDGNTCIEGMVNSFNTCVPGSNQPTTDQGKCSSSNYPKSGFRLYELQPKGNNYPESGVIGSTDLFYEPLTINGLDLSTVDTFHSASYNHKNDGTTDINPYELLLFLLEDSTLSYGVLKNNTTIANTTLFPTTYGNINSVSVTYKSASGGFSPFIYALIDSKVYSLNFDGTTLSLGNLIYTSTDDVNFLSTFYSYPNSGEELNFFLSGLRTATLYQGNSSPLSLPSLVNTKVYLTDFLETGKVNLSYISDAVPSVWGIYDITNLLNPVVVFPKSGLSTSTFSIQPSSTTQFSYNNMVSITYNQSIGEYLLYYYSSGNSTPLPGYVNAQSIIEVSPGKTFLLANNYCTPT